MKFFISLLCIHTLFVFGINPTVVYAQAMPYATTVAVEGANVAGGEVVLYDEQNDIYTISQTAKEAGVYGITSLRPVLVLTTASGTIPVVSVGTVYVRVSVENGPITRGDLLTTASIPGHAMRADVSEPQVFAVALESTRDNGTDNQILLVEMGIEQAQALQQTRLQNEQLSSTTLENQTKKISLVRGSIAAVIVIGGLLFVLYSFRSTIAKGVVSIGRNPRARSSIIALTFGNIFFALLLCAVVVFIAIGVLILPM